MNSGESILITGGTGSFGHCFIPMTLQKYRPKRLVIYSRDEMKQWEMARLFSKDSNVEFVIGDVRDKDRLSRCLDGIDYVVHAAATKIVPIAEYNPGECVKTNVVGALNVIEASINQAVKKVVALSTDKASNPINLYGATKLASDKLFIAANSNSQTHDTKFSIVRYGNVMGSRGSVIPFFVDLFRQRKPLPVTSPDMTRFMLTLNQAVEMVWHSMIDMNGGEVYVRKSPSINIMDLVQAISATADVEVIGIRPGEKMHEQMIGEEDAECTFQYDEYFKILPMIHDWHRDPGRIKRGIAVPAGFCYRSDLNAEWMSVSALSNWIKANYSD